MTAGGQAPDLLHGDVNHGDMNHVTGTSSEDMYSTSHFFQQLLDLNVIHQPVVAVSLHHSIKLITSVCLQVCSTLIDLPVDTDHLLSLRYPQKQLLKAIRSF